MANSVPDQEENSSPATVLLNRQIDARLDARGIVGNGGGGHMDNMDQNDGRLRALENDVHAIKGSLDWAKIVITLLSAITLGGFTAIATLTWNSWSNLVSKVDAVSSKISEEFRAQRLEQAAQISAISNAITATKQQAPQVILVPPQIQPANGQATKPKQGQPKD
ncbi:MAG TPA: hypothetical protein VIF34_00295 [Methylocystis sp.]|jgi:hypothetical protein